MDENQFLNENEIILLISADPGMGKSTILDNLILNSDSETFFIKIVLNAFTKTLKEIKESKIKLHNQDILDIIIKANLPNSHELEITFLKKLAKERKLILMFDGVDEVSDYKEQVKSLIERLNETYHLKKILLTTRTSLKEELEDYFQTISFNLNRFDLEDQINFLIKYWKSSNKRLDETLLKDWAQKLIANIKSSLTNSITQLIGIPLQTKMIAEIYLDKLNSDEDLENVNVDNISCLYQEFVETKFKIKLREKNGIKLESNRRLYEREKERFFKQHITLSSTILFRNNLTESLDEEEISEIIDFGLIVNFRHKMPIFLHQSYAEFFLAKSTLNKLKQNQDDPDEELNQILRMSEYLLVRKFLNDFLLNEYIEYIGQHQNSHKKEIENCCRENLVNLLNCLILNKRGDLKSKNEFLLVASEKGFYEIARSLIKNGIDINQKDSLGKNGLLLATERGHVDVVELLIQNGIDMSQTDEYGCNALHWACSSGFRVIVELVLAKGVDMNKKNKYGQNCLHYASFYSHKEIVEFLIEKGIDVNQKDYDGNNALHWASKKGYKEIVELLIAKGIKINQNNEQGQNALDWASSNGHTEIVQILIENGLKK